MKFDPIATSRRLVLFILFPAPGPLEARSGPVLHKLVDIFLVLAPTLLLSVMAHRLSQYFFYPVVSHRLSDLMDKIHPGFFFLFSLGFIPLVEELSYRLPLRFLTLAFALIFYRLTSSMWWDVSMYDPEVELAPRLAAMLVATALFHLLISLPTLRKCLKEFWQKRFRVVLYLSLLLFAWLHVLNFDCTLKVLLFTPLLTLPQLLMGLSAAYLRVNHGFIYALVFHSLYNSSLYWL